MRPPALSRARYALLRAFASGAHVDEVARVTGWSAERVRREAAAAVAQLHPASPSHVPASRVDVPASRMEVHASLPEVRASPPDVPASHAPARTRSRAPDREASTRPPGGEPRTSASPAERPAVASEVVLEPAPPSGDHRVVHDPHSGRYARMKLPQAAFLESLDGSRTVAELHDDASLPPGMAPALLTRFAELGLLEGTAAAPLPARRGFALKLLTFDPQRRLVRARPLVAALGTPAALVAAGCLALLGTIAFAAHLETRLLTSDRLADPVVVATLFAALLATAALHELGHAGAVVYFGGRVRRMGLMLFYLLPALFCDASDAWRFADARRRVVVALAGIATQLTVVGVVAQLLWLELGDGVRAWVLLYVLLNLGMCAYNLIPFVKLDGYWALSAALDRPSLRATSIERAEAWMATLLYGDPLRRKAGDAALVAFGAACALFAPALVVYALLRWEDLLLALGWAGASAWLLLAAFVAARPVKPVVAALRARLRGPGAVRAAGSLLGLLALLVAGAALVRVPVTAGGELSGVSSSERVRGAKLTSGAVALVEPGDRVQLGDRSLTSDRPEARGEVLRRDGDRWLIALSAGERRPEGDDVTVRSGKHPVTAWLWHAHLRPALNASIGRAKG